MEQIDKLQIAVTVPPNRESLPYSKRIFCYFTVKDRASDTINIIKY